MDFPYIAIQASTNNEDHIIYADMQVRSEFIQIDEAALAQHVQQWFLDNVPEVVSTTAEHREQTFPVTQFPPLP